MIKRILKKCFTFFEKRDEKKIKLNKERIKKEFFDKDQIPWTNGYNEHKIDSINNSITNNSLLNAIEKNKLPENYGYRLDERVVEYPWIFSKISKEKTNFLDAGSTFNFDYIIENDVMKNKNLTIFTYYPESDCFFKNRINYVYGDLRDMIFKDCYFDEVVSQSTIEHIDMDNSIYGYEKENLVTTKSYDYLLAVKEMLRVLKPKGKLLITFPFGKFENHGFFQQFDAEMLDRIIELLQINGELKIDFFKYEKSGWRFAKKEELSDVQSFNPHTGIGKLDDGAAHCRSVACIEFIKKE